MTYPKVGHPPIPMRRVRDGWLHRGSTVDGKPLLEARGDFYWLRDETGGDRRLMLAVPMLPMPDFHDAGAEPWVVSWMTLDRKNSSGALWTWDGNEDKPTLRPSLGIPGYWHGWISAGRLVEV